MRATTPATFGNQHIPVLYQPTLRILQPHSSGLYIDATLGSGGHAAGILQASSPDGQLLGLDVDPTAIAIAQQRLANFGHRIIIRQASYTTLRDQLDALGWKAVNGILLDLGVSSMQLDTPDRGFSFRSVGPLDMRFDPNNPITAATLVNELPENELADIIYHYGEERNSRRIARAIVRARPLENTLQLAEVILSAIKGRREGIHPATRTFQALRIAVNNELQALQGFLPQAVEALAPSGRLVIISFHSLEDRIVKHFFNKESHDCICPPKQPVCTCHHHASLRIITPKPILADADEIQINPRSRSARLRAAEKLA